MLRAQLAFAAFVVVAVFGGTLSCTGDVTDDPGDAVDAGDTGSETGDPAVDTRNDIGGADVGGDVDTADTDIGQEDGPDEWTGWEDEDCDCPEPDEKCSPDFCGLPDAQCGPDVDSTCPDGYECIRGASHEDAFICVCVGDSDECVSECEESHDECGDDLSCNFDEGYCRWTLDNASCEWEMGCPKGTICSEEHDNMCEPTGDLDVGDSCTEDLECESGLCVDGECDEPCLADEDCEGDLRCRWFGLSDPLPDGNGCESVTCTVSCPDDQRCIFDNCRPRFCRTGEDCESGHCERPTGQYRHWEMGTCVEPEDPDIDSYCKPEELYSSSYDYCYLPGTCWDNDDCPDPYECDELMYDCRRYLDDGGGQ